MAPGQRQSDEDNRAARNRQAQGTHNRSGDRRCRAGPPADSEYASYVVVTRELLADHDVSGAAIAEWTKYADTTPGVGGVKTFV